MARRSSTSSTPNGTLEALAREFGTTYSETNARTGKTTYSADYRGKNPKISGTPRQKVTSTDSKYAKAMIGSSGSKKTGNQSGNRKKSGNKSSKG